MLGILSYHAHHKWEEVDVANVRNEFVDVMVLAYRDVFEQVIFEIEVVFMESFVVEVLQLAVVLQTLLLTEVL